MRRRSPMLIVTFSAVLLVVATTVIHYEALRLLGAGLRRIEMPARSKLIIVILATFVAHAVEMLLYGLAFIGLVAWLGIGGLGDGQHLSFGQTLFFSMETYTSLGLGDIVPTGPIRMLVGAETLNGLLLIGWSASYTYLAMERYWRVEGRPDRPA